MKYIISIILLISTFSAFSQLAPTRKLFKGLNRTNSQNLRPALSGNGKTMIYLSDIDQDDDLIKMWQTKKAGGDTWTSPEKVISSVNIPKLNLEGGYFISYDGKTLLFTSRKSGGVGAFDVWQSKRKGTSWETPTNYGKPLNTASNDGYPSISPDGKVVYFTRCQTMTKDKCEGCKIMMSKIGKTLAKEPVELPASINSGNSIAPLILADNKTLIFSSNKNGGKGGYDLFLSRNDDGEWTKPIALDYVNSPSDEKHISIPAKGDIAYFSKEIDGYQNLVKAKIPAEYKQRNILWIQGEITAENLSKVKIQSINLNTGKKSTSLPNAKGEFVLILSQGAKYDVSVRDTDGKYAFHSREDDLQDLAKNLRQKWEIELHALKSGDAIALNSVSFEPYSASLTKEAVYDLNRLLFLMKKNPEKKIEIGVHIPELKTNTVQSDKDLTESIMETVTVQKQIETMDTIIEDSLMVLVPSTKTIEEQVEKITYHNDRTQKQANAVLEYLKSKGIPESRVKVIGYSDKKRKATVVEAIVK